MLSNLRLEIFFDRDHCYSYRKERDDLRAFEVSHLRGGRWEFEHFIVTDTRTRAMKYTSDRGFYRPGTVRVKELTLQQLCAHRPSAAA
jgi:hypothetical protein